MELGRCVLRLRGSYFFDDIFSLLLGRYVAYTDLTTVFVG